MTEGGEEGEGGELPSLGGHLARDNLAHTNKAQCLIFEGILEGEKKYIKLGVLFLTLGCQCQSASTLVRGTFGECKTSCNTT